MELEPNSLLAHQWHVSYLVTQRRMAAAIAEFSRARELDPSSPILNGLISVTYLFARQPHKALKHAREAQANSENFWFGYWRAALAHEQSGQLVEALDQLEKAWERNTSPWITAVGARVYAKLGRREIAEAILDEANRNAGTQWVAPYFVGTAYFALAEIDLAFEWLEKAFHDYDENLNFWAVCPLMDSARSDPRFIDLLGRLGLDQSHAKTHFIVPVVADTPSSG